MRNLLFLFLTIGVSSIALAQKHLPSELVEAKKVYLRNESSEQKMFDKIYELIQKWGRWEIVEKKKDADLELVLEVARRTTQRSAGGKEYTYLVAKNKDGDEIYKEGRNQDSDAGIRNKGHYPGGQLPQGTGVQQEGQVNQASHHTRKDGCNCLAGLQFSSS